MSQVDVVIPCYNYARFLHQCVQSVLSQEGVDVRVLIIDDASKDETPQVGAALAAQDKRVEFRRHRTNHGHIATYNEGLIDWAAGEFSLLLSADDVLIPGSFARAVKLLSQHREMGLAYGRAITTEDPRPQDVTAPGDYRTRILSGAEFWEVSCKTAGNIVPTPTAVVRTNVQQAIGGYRKELPHTGDLEMWMRFAAHGPVGVIDADQAFYRVHRKNMHKATFPDMLVVGEQHRDAFRTLQRLYGDRIAGSGRMIDTAMRKIAVGLLYRSERAGEQGDAESARKFVSLALEISPGLKTDRQWMKFRMRRAIGPRVYGLVRAARRLVRSPAAHDPSPFCQTGLFPGL